MPSLAWISTESTFIPTLAELLHEASSPRFRRAGLVLRRYDAELKERIDARDHLEHFEDRLPGGPKQGKLKLPNDLINMMNDALTYGGRSIDIGPTSIGLLATIVQEFRTAVSFDPVLYQES